jgi:hypothetical protein
VRRKKELKESDRAYRRRLSARRRQLRLQDEAALIPTLSLPSSVVVVVVVENREREPTERERDGR